MVLGATLYMYDIHVMLKIDIILKIPTNNERDRCLHVGGESQWAHRDVRTLPGKREQDRAKCLSHPREEGGTGRVKDKLLFEKREG